MSTKYLALYNCSKRQIVKQFGQHLPNIVILIFSLTLIKKPIVLSDASGLMISSENGQSFFVPNFEAEQ